MNRRWLALLAALTAALLVAACAGPTPADYAAEKPLLDLREYFNGNLVAHGIFTDRSGKVVRRFTVQLKGSWHGDEGVLDEAFTYSDGKTEKRVWHIRKLPDVQGQARYSGQAGDVVGTASGEAAGHALRWAYVLKLAPDQGGHEVDVDDWMYLVDDETLLNRSTINKFGIRFGDITISFRKRKS